MIAGMDKKALSIIGVLVLAVVGVYGWKMMSDSAAAEAMAAMQKDMGNKLNLAQQAADKQMTDAKEQLRVRTENLLIMSAMPLAWSVRSEMLGKNLQQVNLYIDDFVKQPGVKQVVLADTDNVVIAASDRKLEKQVVTLIFPVDALLADQPAVATDAAGDFRLVNPIMGLSGRLGTLIVVYSKDGQTPVPAAATPAPGTAPAAPAAPPAATPAAPPQKH